MIEQNQIPQEASRFHILPFDKPGKNPSLCASKRPISLLSTFMKLLERILVRRLTGVVERKLAECEYAYQRKRSAEVLLADLDSFIQNGANDGQVLCLMGLDIQGAFDNADLNQVITELRSMAVPEILVRFIGNWMTIRTFRVRLLAPTGQYLSSQYAQSRGVPQGGALSPL